MEGLLCARFDVCISNFCDNKTKALISSHFTAGQTEVRIGSWIGAAHTADKQRCWIQTRPGLQISQPFLCIIPRGLVIVQNDNMLKKTAQPEMSSDASLGERQWWYCLVLRTPAYESPVFSVCI